MEGEKREMKKTRLRGEMVREKNVKRKPLWNNK